MGTIFPVVRLTLYSASEYLPRSGFWAHANVRVARPISKKVHKILCTDLITAPFHDYLLEKNLLGPGVQENPQLLCKYTR